MLLNTSTIVKLVLFLGVASAARTPADKERLWNDYATDLNNGDDKKVHEVIANFSNRHAEFMGKLDRTGAAVLFKAATSADTLDSYRRGESGTAKRFTDMIGLRLKPKEVENLNQDVCVLFTEIIQGIKESNSISDACLTKFLENLKKGKQHPSVLTGIRDKWVTSKPAIVAEALMGYIDLHRPKTRNLLQTLPTSAWEAGVKGTEDTQREFCGNFDAAHLNSLTKAQREAIGPFCMSSFKNLETVDLKNLEDYSSEAFSQYNGPLSQVTTGRLPEKHVANFANRVSTGDNCHQLELAHINRNVFHVIPTKCLEGWLSANDSTDKVIGEKLGLIPAATFLSNWKDKSNLGLFNSKDWRYLDYKVLEAMFKDGEVLSRLPKVEEKVGLLNRNAAARITLNKTELKALADACPALASEIILRNVELPGDSLALFELNNIESLVAIRENNIITGFEVFQIIVTQKNGRELILHMGDNADNHWCHSISDVQSFKDKPWLSANLSEKCLNELTFRHSPEAARQLPELAKKSEELVDTTLAEYDEQRWASIEPGFFAALASSPNFCKAMADPQHAKILEKLNANALAMINAQCAIHIKTVITPALAPKLGVNAFALMKHTDMVAMKVTLKDLAVAQIPFVSSFLPTADVSQGYFANVEASELKNLDNTRFAAISSKQWGLVSPKTIKAIFTASKVPSMPSSVLSHITDAQMEGMEDEALSAFTPEQLGELGKAVDAELKAFDRIKEKLDAARANIIKARKETLASARATQAGVKDGSASEAETTTTESSSYTIWWVVGGGALVVILAGVIFIIVRRN